MLKETTRNLLTESPMDVLFQVSSVKRSSRNVGLLVVEDYRPCPEVFSAFDMTSKTENPSHFSLNINKWNQQHAELFSVINPNSDSSLIRVIIVVRNHWVQLIGSFLWTLGSFLQCTFGFLCLPASWAAGGRQRV